MSRGISVDLYVEMTDPQMRVTVEEQGERLEVVLGSPFPSVSGRSSTVQLWFRSPSAVIQLGEELAAKGQEFRDQRLRHVAAERA